MKTSSRLTVNRAHRRHVLFLVAALVMLAATVIEAGRPGPAVASEPSTSAGQAASSLIERGHYLVTAMGCHDCHTPWKMGANGPEPDMSRMLSGHPQDAKIQSGPVPPAPWMATVSNTFTAWAGPWGVSFTANLTPDEETGIGRWTEQEFVATVRSGRHLGRGRPLLPPMPYPNVAALTDDDIHALFQYLGSIPAIRNQVPQPIPPGTGQATGTGQAPPAGQ
jgi:hypothetical protein